MADILAAFLVIALLTIYKPTIDRLLSSYLYRIVNQKYVKIEQALKNFDKRVNLDQDLMCQIQ